MGGGGKETFAMTDVTPNEARMPEDAAVTVTNADTLRAMASPIRMRILGTLRVNGEQTVGVCVQLVVAGLVTMIFRV